MILKVTSSNFSRHSVFFDIATCLCMDILYDSQRPGMTSKCEYHSRET